MERPIKLLWDQTCDSTGIDIFLTSLVKYSDNHGATQVKADNKHYYDIYGRIVQTRQAPGVYFANNGTNVTKAVELFRNRHPFLPR
jgi:hypothetical protein